MTLILGEKIKNLRLKKEISQVELASDILSRPSLSKIENNKILPSLEQLNYIAEKLGVEISYFFYENDIDYETNNKFKILNDLFLNKKYFDIINSVDLKKRNMDIIEYYFLGMAYFNIGIDDESSKNLKKFISLYKVQSENVKASYVEQVAYALSTLGKILLKNKNYNKVLKYLFIADNYLKSYNATDKKINFIVNNNIAGIYGFLLDYSSCNRHLKDFLKNNTDHQYVTTMGSIYINLNISSFFLKDYEDALSYVKKAIFYYNLNNNTYEELESYFNYINALRYLNRFDEAIEVIDNVVREGYSQFDIIEMLKLQKLIIAYNTHNTDKLIEYHKNEKLNVTLFRKKSLMDYYFLCGYIEFTKLNYRKAHSHFLKCEKFLLVNNRFLDLSVMYNIYADILNAQEYKEKANNYKETYYSSIEYLSVNITLPNQQKPNKNINEN